MAISTFPWTTIGVCQGLKPIERCFTHRDPNDGPYMDMRAAASKKPKSFEAVWKHATYNEWLAMVEFWGSVGSFDGFYWQFPIEMFGVGGFGGIDGPIEDPWGWDAEVSFGWNKGPVLLVRFREDFIQQEYLGPNLWGWNCIFDEV